MSQPCRHTQVSPVRFEQNLASLAHAEDRVWRPALAELTLLPEPAGDLLKARYEQMTNSLAKERLKPLVLNRTKIQKQLAGFLSGLYAEYFSRLFIHRRAALLRDCHDVPAQLFFAYAPFDQAWSMLKNSPAEAQLRFLLLRLYAGRDDDALEHLERFSATDVQRTAAQTWWPVEIEPLATDGTYAWTTRAAAVNGNAATHLLRLSTRPASQPGQPDEWLHLDRWLRWTYLFRYKEPILNADAVVFAEGQVRKQNQSGRNGPTPRQEKTEATFWLPDEAGLDVAGPGRCEAVRGIPASARLPVVVLSKEEERKYHGRVVCEWARPLVATPLQNLVHFSPSIFPPPKIFANAEAAAQAGTKKRGSTRH